MIELEHIAPETLPADLTISEVTLAELTAGSHAAADALESARRQDRLQRTEATVEALPIDAAVARAYGRVYAAVAQAGRIARGRRALPAGRGNCVGQRPSTIHGNPGDFAALDGLVEVVAI